MRAAGMAFAEAGVAAVYLVHGTFAGNDLLGLYTELDRYLPLFAAGLRQVNKAAIDILLGETGNYTARYAQRMEAALAAGAGRSLPVRRFHWSGLNHHVGRADGAVRLIDELASLAENHAAPGRVMLWTHSHGGNVAAIATNLLGGDDATREEFFAAARTFYRRPWSGSIDVLRWQRVERLLAEAEHPLRRLPLDIVNFGTPIRYGWDPGGYSKLLHITNHCPPSQGDEYAADFPPRLWPTLTGRGGDLMQQLGIAGSNWPPLPVTLRTFLADRALGRLLQRDMAQEFILGRMRRGRRVPEEGATLLVEYDDPARFPLCNVLGHAPYTRSRWMALHCRLIAEALYDAPAGLV